MRRITGYAFLTVFMACVSLVSCSSEKQRHCIVKPEMFCAPFTAMREHIPESELKKLKSSKETDLAVFHLTVGMYIRNSVNLWEDNEITKFFRSNGATEPDMMSHIMLIGFVSDLNDHPVDMSVVTKRVVAHLQPPPPPPPPPGSQ
jgi:hypothetical protein